MREAWRMVGEYVVTQHDLIADSGARRVKYDSVGMGSYHIDVREMQRSWDYVHAHPNLEPAAFNEGYLSVPVEPYEVPYRASTAILRVRHLACTGLYIHFVWNRSP